MIPSERMCSKMNSEIFCDLARRIRRTSRIALSMPSNRNTEASWPFRPPGSTATSASAQSQPTSRRSKPRRVRAYCRATLAGRNSTRPWGET